MSSSLVVEVAPFTLADGVDEAQLLQASERLEREFLSQADGYLGRVLGRLDDRQWADIVLWESEQHAAAVMPRISSSAACSAYFGCMVGANPEDPGHGVSLFRAVRTYGSVAPAARP
jgi:hypothetical protein